MKLLQKILIATVIVSMLILTVEAVPPLAQPIMNIVCPILVSIRFVLRSIGFGLVGLMLVYGGLRYTFSADDPGGRKQGKNILIHALIGGVLIMIANALLLMITGGAIPIC